MCEDYPHLGTAMRLRPGLSTTPGSTSALLSIQQHAPAMCPDKTGGPALLDLTWDRQTRSQSSNTRRRYFRGWQELWGWGLPYAGSQGGPLGRGGFWGAMRRSREMVAQAEGLVFAKAWG